MSSRARTPTPPPPATAGRGRATAAEQPARKTGTPASARTSHPAGGRSGTGTQASTKTGAKAGSKAGAKTGAPAGPQAVKRARSAAASPAAPLLPDFGVTGMVGQAADQVRQLAGGMLDIGAQALGAARGLQAASAVARSLSAGKPLDAARLAIQAVAALGAPALAAGAGAGKAGAALRKLRETAGLTIDEVARALDLSDPGLIEAVERGKAALPFELILRLASILGRNDPVGFVMKITRSANPVLWQTLEDLGVGRLLLHSARERAFANIYRGHDAARLLSDEEFATVLAFTHSAFEMAMAFHARQKRGARAKAASTDQASAGPGRGRGGAEPGPDDLGDHPDNA